MQLTYLQPLLDWLRTQGSAPASPLYGKPDVARLATMGHSRGGKLAALHYAGGRRTAGRIHRPRDSVQMDLADSSAGCNFASEVTGS